MPTGRYHLHDALQSHRLPFWFGLAGSISDTVRCRRGQLYLGMPDTYPCRAARLSRWSGGTNKNSLRLEAACVCPDLAQGSADCSERVLKGWIACVNGSPLQKCWLPGWLLPPLLALEGSWPCLSGLSSHKRRGLLFLVALFTSFGIWHAPIWRPCF